jgi:hypothetical protein
MTYLVELVTFIKVCLPIVQTKRQKANKNRIRSTTMNLGLMPQIIYSSFSYTLGENLLILMEKKHNIILGFWVVLKLVDR